MPLSGSLGFVLIFLMSKSILSKITSFPAQEASSLGCHRTGAELGQQVAFCPH